MLDYIGQRLDPYHYDLGRISYNLYMLINKFLHFIEANTGEKLYKVNNSVFLQYIKFVNSLSFMKLVIFLSLFFKV